MNNRVLLGLAIGLHACGGTPVDIDADCTETAEPWCAANQFLATLTAAQTTDAVYDWDDATAKTTWSNFPAGASQRNGIALGDLTDDNRTAALAVAATVLSDEGYRDMLGVLAADDQILAESGRDVYGSGNYFIAFIGTPTRDGDWMFQLGGHHLAINVAFGAVHHGRRPDGA